MSKLASIGCIFAGIGLACCLTTWAGLRDRETLAEKCKAFKDMQKLHTVWRTDITVKVPAEDWILATDIVETVWHAYTNRQARAQQVRENAKAAAKRAANVPSVKGIKRVREIRRARREALKGGSK